MGAYSINKNSRDLINLTTTRNIKFHCGYYYFSLVGLCERRRLVSQVLKGWWFYTVNAIVLSIVLIGEVNLRSWTVI